MSSIIEYNQNEFPLLNKTTNESGKLKFLISGLRKEIKKTKISKIH